MAITATALSADLSATGLTMKVAAGTGFPTAGGQPVSPGYICRCDGEFFLATSQPVSGVIKLAQRGYNGTAAAAHDILAKVEVSSLGSDFADPSPGNVVSVPPSSQPVMETIGEDRTFTSAEIAGWGNQTRNFAVTKATAAAIVLVAPSKAQDGLTLVFTSLTAAAHVITATSLIGDAVSGSPHTTATFAAYIGTTVTLQAQNGIYNLVSQTGVTVT